MRTALIFTISVLVLWSFVVGHNSNPENSCYQLTPEEGAPRPPPYLAAVQLWPPSGGCMHLCTATIDTMNSVLTTSSCVAVPEMYFKYLRVVAAVSGEEETQQVRSVEWVDLHHLSDPSDQNITFNIATVIINGTWDGIDYVRPATINRIGGPENMICKYSGWGRINPDSEIVSYFEKKGRYIGDENCKEAIKDLESSERNLIRECLKEITPDSEENNYKSFYAHGGPLICYINDYEDYVVGLASCRNFTSDGYLTGLPIFTGGLRRKYP